MDKEFEKIADAKEKASVKPKKEATKKPEKVGSVKNTIELEPTLNEAKTNTVVLGWGRMNPVTVGHEKLANKIKDVARKNRATPLLYLTHSQDPKKNPLSYDDKVSLAKKAFGSMIQKSNAKTIMQAMSEIESKFDKVILVVGQDRVKEFETLLNKYNGKDYTFDDITVVSAGDRDPDAEGVEGMSASKMRAAAAEGDKTSFVSGLPTKLKRMGDSVYSMVRAGMKLAEELEAEEMLELDEAVLTPAQRRKKAIIMRRFKNRINIARQRMKKRTPTKERLKKIAQRKARDIVRKRITGKKDLKYNELDNAQKVMIDKRLESKKAMINKIAKRIMPKVKRDIMKRMNEEFEVYLDEQSGAPTKRFHVMYTKEGKIKLDRRFRAFKKSQTPIEEGPSLDAAKKEAEREKEALKREHEREIRAAKIADAQRNTTEAVTQDRDIKDREGTQPAKYHSGLAKSTKAKRDAHFKKGAKMDDDNPVAYKPAPGDAEAKTKESQHTKKFRQMYGEESGCDKCHCDSCNCEGDEYHIQEAEFSNDKDLLQMIEEISNEIFESVELEESKTNAALQKKADKSGMPYGVLKKVYDRGVAAWRTGHRPGTTPAQWGMARVNSFVTKSSGTWGKADSDLAAKVRKEEVELEEKLKVSDGAGEWIKDFYKSKSSQFKGKSKEERRKMAIAAFLDAKNEAVSPAQQAAIAIAKKESGEYNNGSKNTKEEVELDAFFDLNESFELSEAPILDKALAAIHKHVTGGADLGDIAFRVSRAREVDISGRELEKKYKEKYGDPYDRKSNPELRARLKRKFGFSEQGGAGDEGTSKVSNRYKKDTPGENVNEDFNDLMEAECQLIGMKQIKEFEKVVDNLFKKFNIDFNFTKHFGERMSDSRNTPCITLKELANFIKKIYAKQGKSIKGVAGAEAVIKDMQTNLNIPVAVTYDSKNDEFDVVMKTIMRKKNFLSPDREIKY